nr:hypothetical protein CFP56_16077 [Quercus suber]
MNKEVELKAFGHERVLEEGDLRFLEDKGSLENVLKGSESESQLLSQRKNFRESGILISGVEQEHRNSRS